MGNSDQTPASAHTPASLFHQLQGPLGTFVEHRILPGWMHARRWFRSKSRPLRAVAFEAFLPCDASGADAAVIAVVRVELGASKNAEGDADTATGSATERYLVPLALVTEEQARTLAEGLALAPVTTPAGAHVLVDGCAHEGFRAGLFTLLGHEDAVAGFGGDWRGRPIAPGVPAAGAPAVVGAVTGEPGSTTRMMTSRILSAEQSNTSLVYGSGAHAVFVKLYRRIEPGPHPEPEMLRFLSGHTSFRNAPGFLSSLQWTNPDGREHVVALAQEFWENATDAWKDMRERLQAREPGDTGPEDAALRKTVALLGTRVGEFHRAAASRADIPSFAPEAFTHADARAARDRARASLAAGLRELERRLDAREENTRAEAPDAAFPVAEARALLAARARIEEKLDAALQTFETSADAVHGRAGIGLKIRTHGDLHLGQILMLGTDGGGRDAGLLDFEGEPGRPLEAARRKQSPLRDVAGMLRSFHYAAHAAARTGSAHASFDPEEAATMMNGVFLDAYFTALAPPRVPEHAGPDRDLLPVAEDARRALLDVFVLEKAAYELAYECDNRPDWAVIPVRGLLALRTGTV